MKREVVTGTQPEATRAVIAGAPANGTAQIARPIVHKPMPPAYGIPAEFDFEQYDQMEKAFKSKVLGWGAFWIVLIFACIAIVLAMNGVSAGMIGEAAWIYVLLGLPILMGTYDKAKIGSFLRKQRGGYLAYGNNVLAYRSDLAAWEFTNSERGLGYWQALRGTDFEAAVALLLRRRGCNVTLTKGSGDGGVDLVLYIGGTALWCQCKGHAKPVSVAPIREIAGVCSRGQAKPVLFAVNGFTGPAIEAAAELGVTCLDAPDLCKLARLEAITSITLRPSVRFEGREPTHTLGQSEKTWAELLRELAPDKQASRAPLKSG